MACVAQYLVVREVASLAAQLDCWKVLVLMDLRIATLP